MKTILATGLSLVTEELDKLPETTRLAVVAVAQDTPDDPAAIGAYVAYRPGDSRHWRIDAGAEWVEGQKSPTFQARVVFAK